MPYHLSWIDERRRILKMQLADPASTTEAEALRSQLEEILNQPGPLYLLADLQEFSLRNAPKVGDASATFRPRGPLALALVGRGLLLKLAAHLLNSRLLSAASQPQDVQIRIFQYEDQAYAWLSALADGLPAER